MNETERDSIYSSVNISPVGWYSAAILLRFEFEGEDAENPKRRCRAWENYHLIKASNPEEAYEKALEIGNSEAEVYKNTDGEIVSMVFEGLTMLVPIYEDLEDGAEIGWIDHENKAVKTIKRMVKPKDRLEVFTPSKE